MGLAIAGFDCFGFHFFNHHRFRAGQAMNTSTAGSRIRLRHSPIWTQRNNWTPKKTLPTLPIIFSTLQGTQTPNTKPTLQRAKNANSQPTPAWSSGNITDEMIESYLEHHKEGPNSDQNFILE